MLSDNAESLESFAESHFVTESAVQIVATEMSDVLNAASLVVTEFSTQREARRVLRIGWLVAENLIEGITLKQWGETSNCVEEHLGRELTL